MKIDLLYTLRNGKRKKMPTTLASLTTVTFILMSHFLKGFCKLSVNLQNKMLVTASYLASENEILLSKNKISPLTFS